MKQHLKSLELTLVTAGIFFGLLVGGQIFFKNYYVADHFQEQLTKIDGIKKVEVKEQIITLTMSNVSNIKQSYQEISHIIEDKNYEIIIKDTPSNKLEEIASESEIALQEGIFRGNFTEMSNYIKNLAQSQGVTAKVFVDNKRVYLQLEEENKYIYRIMERPNNNSDMTG
ncbi:MAG: hypothetical protein AAGU27_05350 [Dehalobacterium sp.]